MRRAWPLMFAVLATWGFALCLGAAACVNALGSDGTINGVEGGAILGGFEAQAAPTSCEEEGGASCLQASQCCGSQSGKVVCDFHGGTMGSCRATTALGTGSTWTELYADYFGGTGRASCAGNGNCHGSGKQAGAAYIGFVCPADDSKACYESLTTNTSLIMKGMPFTSSYLYTALRQSSGCTATPACMPLSPVEDYVFTKKDIDRIGAWVDAGMPNN